MWFGGNLLFVRPWKAAATVLCAAVEGRSYSFLVRPWKAAVTVFCAALEGRGYGFSCGRGGLLQVDRFCGVLARTYDVDRWTDTVPGVAWYPV